MQQHQRKETVSLSRKENNLYPKHGKNRALQNVRLILNLKKCCCFSRTL